MDCSEFPGRLESAPCIPSVRSVDPGPQAQLSRYPSEVTLSHYEPFNSHRAYPPHRVTGSSNRSVTFHLWDAESSESSDSDQGAIPFTGDGRSQSQSTAPTLKIFAPADDTPAANPNCPYRGGNPYLIWKTSRAIEPKLLAPPSVESQCSEESASRRVSVAVTVERSLAAIINEESPKPERTPIVWSSKHHEPIRWSQYNTSFGTSLTMYSAACSQRPAPVSAGPCAKALTGPTRQAFRLCRVLMCLVVVGFEICRNYRTELSTFHTKDVRHKAQYQQYRSGVSLLQISFCGGFVLVPFLVLLLQQRQPLRRVMHVTLGAMASSAIVKFAPQNIWIVCARQAVMVRADVCRRRHASVSGSRMRNVNVG
eukprot:Blabericola_migrator_1__5875@NODE_2976_length_2147_cov_90_782212_g1862_i0_p1_GENE_NODE_2976_length_2147_cov_90_782212_g1862_i0NODE_2976_length_2147_cov_90_782212_g1862_i0_p1_ORF_typecomplete_len368_score23_22Phage_holin_8/PF16931_5/0_21MFS_Mycoplasma/PF07672_13/0_34_NODE_2976_length_2147_cov_90_782212_g1862_i0351138